MNSEEFDRECMKINHNYNSVHVTDQMFDDINFVYTWYPTLSETRGKHQIAHLYMTFGFAIIQDMYDRACQSLKLEHELSAMRESLRELETKQSQLKNGLTTKQIEWMYPTDLEPAQ